MPESIRVTEAVVVPAAALSLKAVRASGPGGQNVNKVATRVELRVDLERIVGLDPGSRRRLRHLVGAQLDAEGRWRVTSQLTRERHRNLEDARRKVHHLVARALVRPKRRRPTRPGARAAVRRLEDKRRRGKRKRERARLGDE